MGLGKGSLSPSEHATYRDCATGALIHRMTAHPSIHHTPYYLNGSFLPDAGGLIFISYRTGRAQLYEVAPFPEGNIRQLTDGPPIHPFSPAIHPDGERLFYVRGGAICVLDRQTLLERVIVEFTGAQLGEVSLDPTGEWLTAAAKIGGTSGLVAGRADGSAWRLIAFPRTVIHPQFHPLEPDWIEFAADPAPRMHRVRRDGTGLECLYRHDNDEFVVHETFLGQTGDLIYCEWPRAVWRFGWQSRERTLITRFNAWHLRSNRAGTELVCDTNHPDEGLFLIDVASGARRRICLSESSNQGSQWRKSRYALAEDFAAARSTATGALSWMEVPTDTVYGPQWTHPHPSFSPDERKVAFTSDRTGYPQVYVVELD
jgi:hypothetical protein